jgi:hypothetical protein
MCADVFLRMERAMGIVTRDNVGRHETTARTPLNLPVDPKVNAHDFDFSWHQIRKPR